MYIYGGNTCIVNNECESGYSLYFPCIKTITRGENACFDFYIIDNTTKEEVDLREIDDITLNLSGRYNCNFGSFSYPENIKSLQVENFSELIFDADFSNIINTVKLYIDIVDENHNLKESVLFDENLLLDIAIEGNIGYFLKGSDKYGILNLNGYDTYTYMFLGWNIDENDAECDSENIYDFLIKSKNLTYNIDDDCVIRAVYQIRREFTINMSEDNFNSTFIVEYMGNKTEFIGGEQITALEGHDIKVSCIPTDIMSYKFVKWEDGYENPYRVLNVSGEDTTISLKAYCELKVNLNDIDNVSEINNIDNTFGETSIQLINDYEQNQKLLDNVYITYELSDLTIIKNDDTGLEYEKTYEISNDDEEKLKKGNRKIEVPYRNLSGELYLCGTGDQNKRYASIYSSDGKYDTSREISMTEGYNPNGIKFNSNDIFEESGKYFIIIGSNGDDYKISKFKYEIYSITPNIICQPEDKNIFVNEYVILSCGADIGSYKWYNATDNTEVGTGLIDTQVTTGSNFDTNSWTTPVFNSVGLYSYYCIVTYGECSVKTNTVTISVNEYYEDNIDASTLNNFKSINHINKYCISLYN